jgi:translocator assembly and maintenance protein 41
MFPPVSFAFYGNHIDRYKYKISKKEQPKLDLILAVEDIREFHEANRVMNKKHYTMMSRSTRNKIVTYFQMKGAKVHFNYGLKFVDEDLAERTGAKEEQVSVRYGVIGYEDLVRDLCHWETLLVAQMMQRPIKTIVNSPQVWEHQVRNLKSALALGALRTKSGTSEAQLYE